MFELKLYSNLDRDTHEFTICNTATDAAYRISHNKYVQLVFRNQFVDWLIEHLELDDADATFISQSLELWSNYIINNTRENEYA